MSQHWKPPSDRKIVRIRPAGDWSRIQSYSGGGGGGRLSSGAKAGLVIMAAACLGVGIGAYQALGPREIVASEAAPSKVETAEQGAETLASPVFEDPSNAEWRARASTQDSPSTSSGRADEVAGVRASFSYCKWGGGTNCVVDGDTIYLNGAKVRIAGIDAPETHDYRCQSELELGERAARELQVLLNSGAVTMTSIDRDRDVYGRLLRNVAVDGRDVGDTLISDGLARPYAGGRKPWCG